MRTLGLFFFLILLISQAHAMDMELGVNYNYKKSAFDENNSTEQQQTTGSISFYFWERMAFELSYTTGLYVKKESQPTIAGPLLRTTTQYTDIYDGSLIFVLADKKAMFQPFIKGGGAYVRVKQVVQDQGVEPNDTVYTGPSPSYGVGFKIFLTEAFAFRASYDAIQTPVNNDTKVTDITGRAGVSWIF